ncbi:Transcription factor, K-box [Dillenia turbinata]|uniref:Transcription factor, K-box n=1 Tax=Dillenia turbinata TaxID=194707 RepID=A0AAN8ZQ28_9MAGN
MVGMEQIISKYHRSLDSLEEEALESEDEPEISALKEHIEKLQLECRQMSGEDIDGLSMEELHELEQQISKGITSVKDRKEQLLYEELQRLQQKEQKVVEENGALQKQIEELQQWTAIPEIPRKKKRSAASCPKTPIIGDEAMHLGSAIAAIEEANIDSGFVGRKGCNKLTIARRIGLASLGKAIPKGTIQYQ